MYGCRVIQKALESVSDEEQVSRDMVTRLRSNGLLRSRLASLGPAQVSDVLRALTRRNPIPAAAEDCRGVGRPRPPLRQGSGTHARPCPSLGSELLFCVKAPSP
jgi:hypothetical protein